VQDWPIPINITELRGVLGLVGYFRRFIGDFGSICRLLFDALKKGDFQWSSAQLVAFNKIKQALCSTPLLALPDFTKPFILEVVASDKNIGAVLRETNSILKKIYGWKIS
jgi:hypothetical protein